MPRSAELLFIHFKWPDVVNFGSFDLLETFCWFQFGQVIILYLVCFSTCRYLLYIWLVLFRLLSLGRSVDSYLLLACWVKNSADGLKYFSYFLQKID